MLLLQISTFAFVNSVCPPGKPTYATINRASPLMLVVRVQNVAKNTFSLQITTLLNRLLEQFVREVPGWTVWGY